MEANNSTLRWPMVEENDDGIRSMNWLRLIYESGSKIDPLKRFYWEKIRYLTLKVNGSLVYFDVRFQGLSILHQDIESSDNTEEHIVIQMVDQLMDPLFAGPFGNIKNWLEAKRTFIDSAMTLFSQ